MKIHFRITRWVSVFGAAALAIAPASSNATPDPVIDQAYLGPTDGIWHFSPAIYTNQNWGQTFTVGLGGMLTRIDLQVGHMQSTVQPLEIAIRKVAGGLPDMSAQGLLYNTQVAASAVPVAVFPSSYTLSIDLAGGAFAVVPGNQLAILLSTTDSEWYNWLNIMTNGYLAGTALLRYPTVSSDYTVRENEDAGFRTWVVVPEPSALLPLALVSLGVMLRRRSARGQKDRRARSSNAGVSSSAIRVQPGSRRPGSS